MLTVQAIAIEFVYTPSVYGRFMINCQQTKDAMESNTKSMKLCGTKWIRRKDRGTTHFINRDIRQNKQCVISLYIESFHNGPDCTNKARKIIQYHMSN